MKVTFRIVGIGERFECNGNTCIKKSTRTAEIVGTGRVFYFGQMDVCKV